MKDFLRVHKKHITDFFLIILSTVYKIKSYIFNGENVTS
jgi:hypothetical protein